MTSTILTTKFEKNTYNVQLNKKVYFDGELKKFRQYITNNFVLEDF